MLANVGKMFSDDHSVPVLRIKDFQVSLASFNIAHSICIAKCLQAECEGARNPQSCILESSVTKCVLVRSGQPFESGPVRGQSLSTSRAQSWHVPALT